MDTVKFPIGSRVRFDVSPAISPVTFRQGVVIAVKPGIRYVEVSDGLGQGVYHILEKDLYAAPCRAEKAAHKLHAAQIHSLVEQRAQTLSAIGIGLYSGIGSITYRSTRGFLEAEGHSHAEKGLRDHLVALASLTRQFYYNEVLESGLTRAEVEFNGSKPAGRAWRG